MRHLHWAGAFCILAFCISVSSAAQPNWVYPTASWGTQTPETVGVKASQLASLAGRIGGSGVVIKDGYLIYSWGTPSKTFDWASASKPVLSTMLFMAINEGKVAGVDTPIGNYGWSMSTADQNLTFRHLANMTSGYGTAENPGDAYSYNDYAINLYGKTLDRVYPGEDTYDGLIDEGNARLRDPLQFQDGVVFGGSDPKRGLRARASTRDFARIGWLWVNKGKWGGTQMIPQTYFDTYCKAGIPSTTPRGATPNTGSTDDYLGTGSYGGGVNQSANGPGIYGFNWWFNTNYEGTSQLTWPSAPADTYLADGRWGKDTMAMIPSLGMVIAADYDSNSTGSWGGYTPGDPNSAMNTTLGLITNSVMHAGDANGDNAVNVGDLGILAGSWGQSNKFWSQGDFSHDGVVNVGDLGILAGAWGWSLSAGSVPEPGTLALMGLAVLVPSWRRRRRSRLN